MGARLGVEPHIGVVIAGNRGDLVWRSKMVQPFGGAQEFLGKPEIDEIAGHRDVVGFLLDDVAGDKVEDLAPVDEFPPTMPVDISKHALRHEVAALGPRHGAQMNVGEMGEGEHEGSLNVLKREEARLKRTFLGRLRPNRMLTAMFRPFWRMRRGLTFGAQGVVIDGEGRVLLVRHGYRPGWWFPGGGVEWGETIETALQRELEEEVGVTLTAAPELHGVFANFTNFPGDHIAVFLVRHWRRREDYRKRGEIAEASMFTWQALPESVDPGTRTRLAEIFDNAPRKPLW